MVKVEARANDEKRGCNVSISMEGNGKDLVEETLAVIQGVMGSLKDEDAFLHLLAIQAIAEHREILLGEEDEDHKAKMFERLMALASIKEGVN